MIPVYPAFYLILPSLNLQNQIFIFYHAIKFLIYWICYHYYLISNFHYLLFQDHDHFYSYFLLFFYFKISAMFFVIIMRMMFYTLFCWILNCLWIFFIRIFHFILFNSIFSNFILLINCYQTICNFLICYCICFAKGILFFLKDQIQYHKLHLQLIDFFIYLKFLFSLLVNFEI